MSDNALTFCQLFDCLPLSGQWFLHKTTNSDPAERYRASWEDTVGNRKTSATCYGETPYNALRNLVVEIKGPITAEPE